MYPFNVLKQKSRLSPDYSIYSETSLAGQQPSSENKYYSVETSHTKIYHKQRKIGYLDMITKRPLTFIPIATIFMLQPWHIIFHLFLEEKHLNMSIY
jgi:hypothetical protein